VSFQAPLLLLSLLVVPLFWLALAGERRRRRKYAVRFPAAATVAAVAGGAPAWRRWVPAALFLAALGALLISLARPQKTVAVPIERASVMLLIDSSGSMQATDVRPTRLDAARNAARTFLGQVPSAVQVGVISYRGFVDTVQRPSGDREATQSVLDGLVADGGTATGEALAAAIPELKRVKGRDGRRAPGAIILLSDGRTTEGRDPVEVARLARREHIPVYTVALGSPGATIPSPAGFGSIPVPPDPETLREIAKVTGAQAFKVDEASALKNVYKRLGSRLGTKSEHRQVTSGFAGVGALLLALALGLSLRWRARLP
jgi:Ca-activated chloride channel family protein